MMNRVHHLLLAVIILCSCFGIQTMAQKPSASPSPETAKKEQNNPFAPEPAGPLPAGMTGADVNDPRAKLTPGFFNAGETAMGLKHILLVKKPAAFQISADNPDDPNVQKALSQMGSPAQMAMLPKGVQLVIAQLSFANSDLAFQGNHLFQGNFYGLNIYDISNPAKTSLLTSMICPGGQNDVSVYKNLLFMSVEMPNGRLDCGTQGFPPPPPSSQAPDKNERRMLPPAQKDRFRGVRIFDISDIDHPKQIAAVQTCRGSHTHTLVTDPNDKDNLYVYVSGTSNVRSASELAGCSGKSAQDDPNTSLFQVEVIKVPLAAPQDAKVIGVARLFADAAGNPDGLAKAGDHGPGTQTTAPTNMCHDIIVYPAKGLGAGACSGNGILIDIKDAAHP